MIRIVPFKDMHNGRDSEFEVEYQSELHRVRISKDISWTFWLDRAEATALIRAIGAAFREFPHE